MHSLEINMDQQTARKLAENEYKSYRELCQNNGISIPIVLTDAETGSTSTSDLVVLAKHLKDLVRSPH